MNDNLKIRSFEKGTIAELAAPVSATEVSERYIRRQAAHSSQTKSEADMLGHIKQHSVMQGNKRVGGGWKKRSITK